MTQSIIVYRNPIEAAFWESGLIFPLMVALFVGFITILATSKLVEMKYGNINSPKWAHWLSAAISVAAACAVFVKMF